MNAGPPDRATRFPIVLLLIGLALRLPGLLFNGMADLLQIIFEWGAAVHHTGLVHAFGVNYGILSYAAFGAAEAAAEWMPRFWWAPYKLFAIGFEVLACLALLAIVRPRYRRGVLLLIWLNPWFVLHGAYYGFWEGPHLLFGLLAVLALQRIGDNRRAWAVAGALVMCSAMFKPQGLVHFAGPLIFYLAVQAARGTRRPLAAFVAGLSAVVFVASLAIWADGGNPLAIYDNYRSVSTSMAKLSNGGPGLWRFVSWAYMEVRHQPGLVLDMKISRPALAALSAAAGLLCLALLSPFALRLGLQRRDAGRAPLPVLARWMGEPLVRWPDASVTFAVLTLGALVMSQFGPRAHINHSYAAMVLLAVFALRDRVLFWLWIAMNVMLGLAHVSAYGLGAPMVMLPMFEWHRYPNAGVLLERIGRLPEFSAPDGLLRFQSAVNGALAALPGARGISMMSVLVCLAACGMLWRLFSLIGRRTDPAWQLPLR